MAFPKRHAKTRAFGLKANIRSPPHFDRPLTIGFNFPKRPISDLFIIVSADLIRGP
ncbi:hypothetical protein ACIPPQ_17440 [Sphingopyxis sp. LARHCG72]